MAPRSVFITGANRGLGLGLVKELLKNERIEILIATCRDPENAGALAKIKQNDPRLHILQLEVSSDDSIRDAFKRTETLVGDRGLNLLINNAGVLVPYNVEQTPNRAELVHQLDVNSVSIVVLTQIFLPLLKKAASLVDGNEMSVDRAALVNISSTAASVAKIDGTFNGPLVAYRMSKSALNSFAKSCSIDLAPHNVLVASFCPGWVQTDMGGANAELTIDQSMAALVPNILQLSRRHHGGYFDRNLQVIPN